MGIMGSAINGGVKNGLRVFGRSRTDTSAQPTELEKMAKETVHQLGQNNAKLMDHIESLMEQHGEMAKLLLDTIKKMHGMGWNDKSYKCGGHIRLCISHAVGRPLFCRRWDAFTYEKAPKRPPPQGLFLLSQHLNPTSIIYLTS